MLSDAVAFWDALAPKVRELIRQETQNTIRCERYDVVNAPNGNTIEVKAPFAKSSINIPYSSDIANAKIGDTVLVQWTGTLSTAIAISYGDWKTDRDII